ncbi:MAG TPA: hypothetical protein VGH99_12100 [Pseudonocardia sp.]|jgi:hypothetical protein
MSTLHLHPTEPAAAVTPAPRAPLDGENDAPPADLAEVAVWTSDDGAWQEHATFLLLGFDGSWRSVAFADPAATELVPRLRRLPGFDGDLLLDLLNRRYGRRIVTLWRHPAAPPR